MENTEKETTIDFSNQRPSYICGICGYKIIDGKCPCSIQGANKPKFNYRQLKLDVVTTFN